MKYKLSVSESANVRPGSFRMSVSVIYAGMINDNKYSIVVSWSYGYQSAAYNLFLSPSQKVVSVPKGEIHIENVSEKQLTFIFHEK